MRRALIVPAAGRGSRLRVDVPKLLVPVGGRTMLEHLLGLYRHHVAAVVVVVSPSALPAVQADCEASEHPVRLATQKLPTGMLDAVMAALPEVEALDVDRVWITWCDQLAIRPQTLAKLAATELEHPEAAIVLPTAQASTPYIHFSRDAAGRIDGVLQRREGDLMPDVGESDTGLFSLSRAALGALEDFSETASRSSGTAERNFLPFIPWMAQRAPVVTFPCSDPFEAVGVNTPDELREVERFLAERTDA